MIRPHTCPENRVRYTASLIGAQGSAPDVLIFVDYECPYCRAVDQTLRDLTIEDDLTFGVLHFPLSIHQGAEKAALVAICAELSGTFSAVHDFLMTDVSWMLGDQEGERASFMVPESQEDCTTSQLARDVLKEHRMLAELVGVRSTPTFITRNGVLRGALSKQEIRGLR